MRSSSRQLGTSASPAGCPGPHLPYSPVQPGQDQALQGMSPTRRAVDRSAGTSQVFPCPSSPAHLRMSGWIRKWSAISPAFEGPLTITPAPRPPATTAAQLSQIS